MEREFDVTTPDGAMPCFAAWPDEDGPHPVIVMYMAMKHLGSITRNLLNAGRSASEPLAIICNASLPHQSILETTLGEAVHAAEEQHMAPPAIVVLGEVVRLRAALDWMGALEGRVLQKDPLNNRSQSEVG